MGLEPPHRQPQWLRKSVRTGLALWTSVTEVAASVWSQAARPPDSSLRGGVSPPAAHQPRVLLQVQLAGCPWVASVLMRLGWGKGLGALCHPCVWSAPVKPAKMIPHAPWEVFLRTLGLFFTSNICDSVNIYETQSESNLGQGGGGRH